jgi:hypothetical protein
LYEEALPIIRKAACRKKDKKADETSNTSQKPEKIKRK